MGGLIDGLTGLMDSTLAVGGWSLFALAILVGLALDMVGLFGNWIILGASVIAWIATGFDHFGIWSLAFMGGFAVLGEVLETAFAGYGAKKFGGSKGSIVAALVGCILGAIAGTAIPIPLVGNLIGACLGAFVGAALYEYIQMEKQAGEAMWTGFGAALGKVGGLFAKLFCGIAMLAVASFGF